MSAEKSAEVVLNKESLFHSIGILCDMMIGFEENFQSCFDENEETYDDDRINDHVDLIMSTLALLCEPFNDHPDLIEECKNYCLMNCGIDIESIMFDDEDTDLPAEVHLTLVSDNDDGS